MAIDIDGSGNVVVRPKTPTPLIRRSGQTSSPTKSTSGSSSKPKPSYDPYEAPSSSTVFKPDELANMSQSVFDSLINQGYTTSQIISASDEQGQYFGLTPQSPSSGGGGGGAGAANAGGGGGGGGGGSSPGDGWNLTYTVEGAPTWWQGKTPSSLTPETSIASVINSMIPFMSPEDQRTTAQNLYRQLPEVFPTYDPRSTDFPVPINATTGLRQRFQSADRARDAQRTLLGMAEAAGKSGSDFGPGFGYLQQLLDVMGDFGGGGEFFQTTPGLDAPAVIPEGQDGLLRISNVQGGNEGEFQHRTQRRQMLAALDPLLAETKGEALSSFGPLAQYLAEPFFSAGDLSPQSETPARTLVPGRPNPRLFR